MELSRRVFLWMTLWSLQCCPILINGTSSSEKKNHRSNLRSKQNDNKQQHRQTLTQNLNLRPDENKPEFFTNWPLTLFAITDSSFCSNDLPYGLKSTWDQASPYFCTDCTLNVSNFWLQLVSVNGNLKFSIIWQFDTLKTLSQRLQDASKIGEAVTWIVTTSDGGVRAMRGVWRWSSPGPGGMDNSIDGFSNRDFCFGAGDYVDGMSLPPLYGHCSNSHSHKNPSVNKNNDMCGTLFENGEHTVYDNVESKMYATPRSWVQVGEDLDGLAPGDEFGYSSSLSPDGKCLAVGAPWNDGKGSSSGVVRIFREVNGSWKPIGSGILGHESGDLSGYSVSTSRNCERVAIGSIWNDGNGPSSGMVRVYQNEDGNWLNVGQDIHGDKGGDYLGWSVSLSEDGERLAVGAHGNDDNGSNSGHVKVFKFDSNDEKWEQLGQNIKGEMRGDSSGWSVSLSGDGQRVVIGAQYNDKDGLFSGHVRVFSFDADIRRGASSTDGTWRQLGRDIDGAGAYDFSGVSVSTSRDGSRIAIGSSGNDDNGDNAGHVRIYEYHEGNWEKIGNSIVGESNGDESGFSVSLSSNGTCVAVGARYNDGNGIDSGHVRIHCYNGSLWSQIGEDIDGENSYDWSGYSVSLSEDGTRVAVGARYNDGNGFKSGQVRVFDLIV